MIRILNMLDGKARKTFVLESLRSVFMGCIETASNTFFLLYMVKVLQANDVSKSIVVTAGSFGLLISPLITQVSAWCLIAPATLASLLYFTGGIACFCIPMLDSSMLTAALMFVAVASWNSVVPLTTQIYADNYPKKYRGTLFSVGSFFRITSAATFAYVVGNLIDVDLSNFNYIFYGYAICFFISFIFLTYLPKSDVKIELRTNSLFEGLTALRNDSVFRVTIISWMFMGFGNLLLLPLRVEYLANQKYGISLSPKDIAMFVTVIPNIARLLCVFVWGVLFDNINFFSMRIIINLGFMAGVLSFFLTSNWYSFFVGAVLYGISTAGGDVAWNLWVTKLAAPGKSKSYMSVHTFFTGVRGIIAPSLAFYLLSFYSFSHIAILSLAFIFIGSLILMGRGRL